MIFIIKTPYYYLLLKNKNTVSLQHQHAAEMKIYLLLAHPDANSFNGMLADAYEKAANKRASSATSKSGRDDIN
jgi:hypothetical protein